MLGLALIILAAALLVGFSKRFSEKPHAAINFRMAVAISLAVLLPVVLLAQAIAQTATITTPGASTVHIDPSLMQNLVDLGVALVLAIGGLLWKVIDNYSPLKNTTAESVLHGMYLDLLQTATKYGATQLDAKLTKVGDVDVGNPAIAAAANFVISHGPDIAKRAAGIDVSTPEGQAKIVQSITARLGPLMESVASNKTAVYRVALPPQVLPASTPTQIVFPTSKPTTPTPIPGPRTPQAKN